MNVKALKPENFRSIADYAKAKKYGIGSFRLNDGSSVKILTSLETSATEFYKVKKGQILERMIFEGEDAECNAALYLCNLERLAEDVNELNKAWAHAIYTPSDL